MPLYEFRFADGTQTEEFFGLDEMPRIGDCVEIDGKAAIRVISAPRATVANHEHEAFHMLSERHGRDPDVPRYSKPGNGHVGGFPLFANKREIREYEAKKGLRYDR